MPLLRAQVENMYIRKGMIKMEKRYVTRQYLWNAFYTWGVWDKKECKWIVNDRLYKRNVIEIADKLNKEEKGKLK